MNIYNEEHIETACEIVMIDPPPGPLCTQLNFVQLNFLRDYRPPTFCRTCTLCRIRMYFIETMYSRVCTVCRIRFGTSGGRYPLKVLNVFKTNKKRHKNTSTVVAWMPLMSTLSKFPTLHIFVSLAEKYNLITR